MLILLAKLGASLQPKRDSAFQLRNMVHNWASCIV